MITTLLDTSKGEIEYSLLGQGKPILFVHGGHVDCRETIFHKGLDSNNFCFITPSRPGYGKTPLSILNKTPKGTAELFVALLDKLELSTVIVFGISAGGLTALELAANFPDRVESLVLMSALTQKWFVENDKVYIWGKRLFAPKMEMVTWSFYRLFFRFFPKNMAKAMFKELSTCRPVKYTENELMELKHLTMKMRSGQGFSNDLDQTIEQTILNIIDCPTLILHSENDNAVGMLHALNAEIKIKKARLLTFNNRWGHLIWLGADYGQYLNEIKKHIHQKENI